MKTAAIFCVLVIVCFFQTGDAANNAGSAAISRLKTTAKSTANDLERYGRKLTSDLSMKLSNQKITQLGNINNIVNPAINSIRSEIDAAKANGKDAERCYEPARLTMRQSTIDAGNELEKCKQDGLSSVSGVKSNIDAAVVLGQRTLPNELDAIAVNCISSNALAYQNCIIAQIPNVSQKVKAYQSTADMLKRTGDSQSSSAVTEAFGCSLAPPQKVRQAATDARLSATSCIANA